MTLPPTALAPQPLDYAVATAESDPAVLREASC
jgi:hypothetical protein